MLPSMLTGHVKKVHQEHFITYSRARTKYQYDYDVRLKNLQEEEEIS